MARRQHGSSPEPCNFCQPHAGHAPPAAFPAGLRRYAPCPSAAQFRDTHQNPYSHEEVFLTAAQILVRDNDAFARRSLSAAPEYGWFLLGWMGLVFTLVGGLDLALGWYPLQLGNPQWEFGTVSRTYDMLPITALGLVLLLGSGVARGARWWIRSVGVALLVLGLAVAAGMVLYALNIPLALKSVVDPLAMLGIKRAIVKALGQGVLYTLVFVVLGISALRHSAGSKGRS